MAAFAPRLIGWSSPCLPRTRSSSTTGTVARADRQVHHPWLAYSPRPTFLFPAYRRLSSDAASQPFAWRNSMAPTDVPPALGLVLMVGLGLFMLIIAFAVRRMARSTHDFVIAGRRIGLGFGVGSVIAVWTWSMAVMMSSAQAYTWGTSGLLWFIVPNGLAVVAMVPFALRLRRPMPRGYTIVEFVRARFASWTASSVILAAMLLGLL